ncbi:MAG: 50S ribosomal protein L29 [Myxococcota bacterium]
MKTGDIRKLDVEELEARVREARDHLFNLKIKHATGQLENSASVRSARRDLARALTVRNEKSRTA